MRYFLWALASAIILLAACSEQPAGVGDPITENYKNGKLYKDCQPLQKIDSDRYLYHCITYYESGIKRSEGNYINGVTPIG